MSRTLALNDGVPAAQTMLFPDPRPLVERLGADFFRQLPERPGVYLMHGPADAVLYVGKAKSLKHRLGSYRVANPDRMRRRHLQLLRQVVRIELEECADEAAALARESELLRTLKPKFNRAGVWSGPPRFLLWRSTDQTVEFAISKSPAVGWQEFGPCGSGVIYLRAALARLLWLALNPSLGSPGLPAGWWHGQMGAVATVRGDVNQIETVLVELFAGDTDGFAAWIADRTQALAHGYDLETREADLETVITLIQAKAKRTQPFAEPETSSTEESDSPSLFSGSEWRAA